MSGDSLSSVPESIRARTTRDTTRSTSRSPVAGVVAPSAAAAVRGNMTLPVNVSPFSGVGVSSPSPAAARAGTHSPIPGSDARSAAADAAGRNVILRAATGMIPVNVAPGSIHPIIGSPISTMPPTLFPQVPTNPAVHLAVPANVPGFASPSAQVPSVISTSVAAAVSSARTNSPSDAASKSTVPPPINDNIQELFDDSDPDEYIDAETELALRENSLKTLFAMSIGLKDQDGLDLADLQKEPFASFHNLKTIRPDKNAYYLEVCRRHSIKKITKRDKIGKTLPNKTYLELLQKNPITQPACIEFLEKKIRQFKTDIIEEKKEREKQINSNRARGSYFTGLLYKIRVIECMFRENAKSALANFFNSLTREELDGRNNPEAARACPWTIGANNYNDNGFDVVSVEFPMLHEEFKDTIKVTYDDVKHMGKMTPDRMKTDFSKMQVEMKVFLSRWARSGNGEGTRERDGDDVLGSDDDDCGLGGCMEEKRNFLGKFGPHILYLEARSNQVGLFQVVAQTMKEGMEMDGDAPSVFKPNKKQKKNSTDIDTVYADLNKEISKTNRALAISNLESKKERRSMLMKDNRDLQVRILEFRERGVSEGILEVLQEGHDQVANEIKELDAEIEKYEAEMTDEVQVNSNN